MLGVSLNIFTLAIRRYFGGGGGQFAGSALNLDMTSGNRTLDPRISFSRASNATVTGSDGTLQYAPHNLLTFSEQFDNALWAKNVATVTANLAVAPDGTTTADLLTSTGADGYAGRNTLGLGGGLQYTASVYLRADAPTTLRLYLVETAGGSAVQFVTCNVTTEWQRFSVSLTTGAAVTAVSMQVGGGSSFGTGKAAYLWGAQLNIGTLQPYYPTTVKNLLGFTQEFDNAAWTKSNSLIQTNQIRNNTGQGAVAGTPGTLPTNWLYEGSGLGTLTQQVVGVGTEGGISYIDLRISGTSSVAGLPISYESRTAVPAALGQTWNQSAYLAVVGGSVTNIQSILLRHTGRNSTGTAVDIVQGEDLKPSLTGSLLRFSSPATFTVATVAFNQPNLTLNFTAGVAIDITLRIGMPQLVQGATAGDVVATYGTARAVMYPAPDGSVTADKLVENTANSQHICQQLFVPTAGGRYTLSHNVKAAERSFAVIGFSGGGLGADCVLGVNLTTGAVVSTAGAPESTSVVSLGSGWYRVSVTKTLPTATNCNCRVLPSTDGINQVYTGDGTSGLFIWGAQLSDSASLDPYVYNPGAAPTSQAYYGPRFDYDPATLSPRGLLIEEQRSNLVLQSQSFDDVYWTKARASITANTAVSPDGTQNAEALIEDSTTSNTHLAFSSSVAVATGTVYTYTIYAKASGRSWFNMQIGTGTEAYGALVPFCFFNVSNGTVGTSANATGSIASVGNGWFRCTLVAIATTAATTTNIRIKLADSGSTDSYTGDGTSGIYIWGAQLEAGSFATSYIPTTTAAATRAADVAVMTGANFNNWYNQSEGTLFSEFSVFGVGSASNFNGVAVVDDGTVNNAMELAMWDAASDSLRWVGYVGGTAQWSINPKNYSTPLVTKGAGAYRANSFNGAFDGVLGAEDTAGSVPVVSTLRLGANRVGSGNYLNGHIRRIAFYPRRLSNAELQGITQ